MVFKRIIILIFNYLFLLISHPLVGQEINQDSSINKLLKLKTDYNKKIYESSFYTIQIYYGDLKEADSISKVFSQEFEEIKTNFILTQQYHIIFFHSKEGQ